MTIFYELLKDVIEKIDKEMNLKNLDPGHVVIDVSSQPTTCDGVNTTRFKVYFNSNDEFNLYRVGCDVIK